MLLLPPVEGGAGAGGVVLDAGEGTWAQLVRLLGADAEAPLSASSLNARVQVSAASVAFISHLHADHHVGLPTIIRERRGGAPLLVIGPSRLYLWLLEVTRLDTTLFQRWAFVDCEHFLAVPAEVEREVARKRVREADAAVAVTDEVPLLVTGTEADSCGGSASASTGTGAGAGEGEASCATLTAVEAPPSYRGDVAGVIPYPKVDRVQHGAHLASAADVTSALARVGATSLRTARVRHCARAYALRIEGGGEIDPWSVVYSGDTRPCAEVIALAKGGAATAARGSLALAFEAEPGASGVSLRPASLLIHEATFDDSPDGFAHALEKRHSTAAEAMRVAAAARVGFTVLTHFSARYPKLPVLGAGVADGRKEGEHLTRTDQPTAAELPIAAEHLTAAIAYDLWTFQGATASDAPRLMPALRALFAEEACDAEV